MLYLLLSAFLLLSFAYAQSFSPKIDPDKFTICTITINSDDEKKLFSSEALKQPNKFNPVVELTDFGNDKDWFEQACKSGVRCDQLVISGHFAGKFFGEDSDKSLSLKDLEVAGCSESCSNILSQPYEVFLFGCNTLATKDEDQRTPAQYLQVLLRDNIPLAQAELIVQSRYGSIGDSNKSGMQRAFNGSKKQIYGFDSIAPSGANVKGFLKNYFSKINLSSHLEKLQAKRIIDEVNFSNQLLEQSLSSTAFSQCGGGNLEDPITKNICKILDSTKSIDSRLALISEIFATDQYLVYLPAINNFFKTNSSSGFSPKQQDEMKLISKNEIIKSQIIGLIKSTDSLGLLIEWSEFGVNAGFINSEQKKEIVRKRVVKYFEKPLTLAEADILCSAGWGNINNLDLKFQEMQNRTWNEFDVKALSCLNITDVDIYKHALRQSDLSSKAKTLLVFSNFLDEGLHQRLLSRSDFNDTSIKNFKKLITGSDDVVFKGIDFLSRVIPEDPELKAKVSKMLLSSNPKAQENAIRAFAFMKVKDPNIHLQIANILKTSNDPYLLNAGSFALRMCDINDPVILEMMRKIIEKPEIWESTKKEIQTYLNSIIVTN